MFLHGLIQYLLYDACFKELGCSIYYIILMDYHFFSSLNKLFFGELPFLSLMGVNVMMMPRFQNVAVENDTVHVLFDNHEQLLLPVE